MEVMMSKGDYITEYETIQYDMATTLGEVIL